ncbi:MAG: ATP-dependent DNA helicase Rep [Sodalis sp.]|nr:MAG: ATP-dependent DNA helicase Rep [Sodalis sp.]
MLDQAVTRFTLRDMMERSESEEQLDQVQLMTLHASKGLEFAYIFLVGMLPYQSSVDENSIDKERRLAYLCRYYPCAKGINLYHVSQAVSIR